MQGWQDKRLIFAVFIGLACTAGIDKYRQNHPGRPICSYNNFVIFRNSAEHVANGTNLYIHHPQKQYDLFLYSPTAAWAFTPFLHLPDLSGLLLWDTLNAVVLVGALAWLPRSRRTFAVLAWLVLKESFTGFQASQSNGLTTGLMVLTLACLERKQPAAAAFVTIASLYLKVFGFASAALWLVFPQKTKFAVWGMIWFAALGAAPLLVTTPDSLFEQYASWRRMHTGIQTESFGLGIPGMLHAWFGITAGKGWLPLVAAAVILLPCLRRSQCETTAFRQTLLAALMLWANLFNHKLEPPTCIVGVTGVALWFLARPQTRGRIAIMAGVFVCTCWGNSDLVPQWLQDQVVDPLFLKTVPLAAVWVLSVVELARINYRGEEEAAAAPAEESEEHLPLPLRVAA